MDCKSILPSTFSGRGGKSIQMLPPDGSKWQTWVVYGERIASIDREGETIEILDGEDEDGAKVVANDWEDADHQKWEIEYV